jgi:hypothetical protein
VFNVDIYRPIGRRDPRFVGFRVRMNLRRKLFGPGRRQRIHHERAQAALLVEQEDVRVIVGDDSPDVRCDRRPEFREVTLGHDSIRDLDQRPQVIALGLEIADAALVR